MALGLAPLVMAALPGCIEQAPGFIEPDALAGIDATTADADATGLDGSVTGDGAGSGSTGQGAGSGGEGQGLDGAGSGNTSATGSDGTGIVPETVDTGTDETSTTRADDGSTGTDEGSGSSGDTTGASGDTTGTTSSTVGGVDTGTGGSDSTTGSTTSSTGSSGGSTGATGTGTDTGGSSGSSGTTTGCAVDTDSDGTPDCDDDCPTDPDKTDAGICGCGTPDTDSDSDTVADCNDGCPFDMTKTDPGADGCGSCPMGTADCDGAPGCEADFGDAETCGACNKTCVTPGGTLSCMAGTCAGTMSLDVDDAFVWDVNPDHAFGADAMYEVKLLLDFGPERIRILVQVPDLSFLPASASVSDASLEVTCYEAGDSPNVHRVTAAWAEDTVTWNNQPGYDGSSLGQISASVGRQSIDVTALFQDWVDGTEANHGVMFVPRDTFFDNGSDWRASEYPTTEDQPKYVVDVSY